MRRPRILQILLCAVVLCTSADAQQLVDLGLKGGVNRDDLSSSYQHAPIVGGHVGIFVRLKPPVFPGVQGEVLLSTTGTSATVEGQEVVLRSATLQLPLFAVFALGPAELHAGGYYEHQLAKQWNVDIDLEIEGEDIGTEDLRDGTFGLLLGAGVRFGHFYAGGRYNHGLESLGTSSYLSDVKNRQLQFYLGWGFLK